MENDVLDELMALAGVDPEEFEYIRKHISPELSEKYDDETIQYILDVLDEYCEKRENEDEEDIALDDVAQYVVAMAAKEKIGQLDANDVAEVLDAEFDYLDSLDEAES